MSFFSKELTWSEFEDRLLPRGRLGVSEPLVVSKLFDLVIKNPSNAPLGRGSTQELLHVVRQLADPLGCNFLGARELAAPHNVHVVVVRTLINQDLVLVGLDRVQRVEQLFDTIRGPAREEGN